MRTGVWRVDRTIFCKHLQLFDITSNGFFRCLGHMYVILVSKQECFRNIFMEIIITVCILLKGYGYCTATIHGHVLVVPVHQYDVSNWVVSLYNSTCNCTHTVSVL